MNPAEHEARADAERSGSIVGGDVDRIEHALLSDDELMAEGRALITRIDPVPASAWPVTLTRPLVVDGGLVLGEDEVVHGAWANGEDRPVSLWGTDEGGV
jgi:hypothetical protein